MMSFSGTITVFPQVCRVTQFASTPRPGPRYTVDNVMAVQTAEAHKAMRMFTAIFPFVKSEDGGWAVHDVKQTQYRFS